MFKSVVYAILISGIACLRGFEADRDAKGVGHAATSAVVSSLFLIVVADAIITVLMNQ
jgi:phospholipid/cholesterol/gamma-HCH transport system permease protein